MVRDRIIPEKMSEFLKYLANCSHDEERIPPLVDLSRELGVSIASLREQLEVARVMGFVEVRPKTGIRRLPYTFRPAVVKSLSYGLAVNPDLFRAYSDMRNHIESAYWFEAVSLLQPEDLDHLRTLVNRAQEKLHGRPIQIPHDEHRELHLSIYRKLDNLFVLGILEGYWELYKAVGLDLYTDFNYLDQVWKYHQKMVDALCNGDFQTGYRALTDHMNLLSQRDKPVSRQKFE